MNKTKALLIDFLNENNCPFFVNEPLKEHTTIGIGGKTPVYILPSTENFLIEILSYLRKNRINYRILGRGSNVIPDDDDNVVIISSSKLNKIEYFPSGIVVDAGISVNKLVPELTRHELSGFEFLAGLPGSIGGALYMNAGAFGREIGDLFESARVIDKNGKIKTVSKEAINFGYRYSSFQNKQYLILAATFNLHKDSKIKVEKRSNTVLNQRIKTQPVEWKSAGSIFKKPSHDFSVGYAIDKLGLKGIRFGGAEISKKHAGFIINRGNASQHDIKQLIGFIKTQIKEHFGVLLETEVELW
jgi:UDP-N-acetylmuramate dehydrogenase